MVKVITRGEFDLREDRAEILNSLGLSQEELRSRVDNEVATPDEREMMERLEEIAFLLGEDE